MDLVITEDKLIISKETAQWQSWQDKLFFYKRGMHFNNEAELAEHLQSTYSLSGVDIEKINEALTDKYSQAFELELPTKDEPLQVRGIAIDILGSKRQLIFWEDWFFVLSRIGEELFLWVYVGGMAEVVREIRLNQQQKTLFRKSGKPYVYDLANRLQQSQSSVYAEAIEEKRRIL
jgi:hypothetical protein